MCSIKCAVRILSTQFHYLWITMKRSFLFLFILLVSCYIVRSQCPTGLTPGPDNLVTNGDFSAGNTAFTSDYSYCNTAGCLNAAELYSVGVDPSFYNSGWVGADHTTGTGNFLIANGATVPNTPVWCQMVTFEPSSYYIISFWVSSLDTINPASIQLYIAGFPFFSPAPAPGTTNTWAESNNTFQSGILETTEVCLYNVNTNDNGNNFGIDDISIRKCQCNLAVTAGPDKSMCYGDSVQLEGSGSVSYFWSPTNSLSCFTCSNPVATPQASTTYTVTVNGPGGCTAIDSVTVTVFPQIDLHAGPDTTICFGNSLQLHADGAVSYSWQPAAGLSNPGIANPVASPLQTTTYYLSAVDASGCNQFDSTTIEIFPSANSVAVTPHDTTICLGGHAELHASNAETYSWQPQQDLTCITCPDPIATPRSTITYIVTGIDTYGCSAGSDSVKVEVDPDCSHVAIPSAFSPNNDGRNDFFHALNKGVTSFNLRVYNRWGIMVFSSENPDSLWDGKLNGMEQPVGVYIWVVKAQLDDGTIVDQKGNVTLVR